MFNKYASCYKVIHVFLITVYIVKKHNCNFLFQESILRLLRHLPDIIRLQQMLIDKYHRRIDAAEATSMSIQDFLDSLPQGKWLYP